MSRRDHVPFDPRQFEKRRSRGEAVRPEDAFAELYRSRGWHGEAASGEGATPQQTETLRAVLPGLFRALGVQALLDVPCGDFGWMQHLDLDGIDYVGGDLVPEIVAANRARYGGPGRRFVRLDLTRDELPEADLLLCRDGLVHLSNADIDRALANIRRAPIRYLLTTTFPATEANEDIVTGDWRPINLERSPFGLPPPLRLVDEGCTEAGGLFADKSLGLWEKGGW